jgi:acetyl-CoA/propionyl-CoA carboxylase biotin carboxyl carrier protein
VIGGAFDSLLAKLIVTGANRTDAIERAKRALNEFEVAGLPTVLPFHRAVLEEQDFVAQKAQDFKVHTTWIEKDFANNLEPWSGAIQENQLEEDLYRTVVVEVEGRRLKVGVPSGMLANQVFQGTRAQPPKRRSHSTLSAATAESSITSPMQATVVKIAIGAGENFSRGDLLLVLEAMKMEQQITAEFDGTLGQIYVSLGDSVVSGQTLLDFV